MRLFLMYVFVSNLCKVLLLQARLFFYPQFRIIEWHENKTSVCHQIDHQDFSHNRMSCILI